MPTTALHLAYRPQTLEDLVGQPYVKTTLTNAIASQQIAPAYLFTGPRGTGKTSTARIFAKSLNCLSYNQPTLTPCGKCQSCRSIQTSSSLDVSEIDAASNNGVDDARALIERVNFAPALGRYRIFILDEVHSLTSNAFNTLLKCIEEPPKHVVFMLCTTEAHKVIPTIISRCQKFEFRAISTKTIAAQLRRVADAEEMTISDEALLAIARLVDGGMRDALQLLTQASLLNSEITADQVSELAGGMTEGDLLAILQAIASSNVFSLLQAARELIDAGKSPKLILSNLLQIYRDLLIVKSAPQERQLLTGAVRYPQLKQLAQQWSYETINAALAQLQRSETQLRQATNANVWIEVCLLNLIPGLGIPSVIGESTHNGSKRTAPRPDLNLTEIWQQVRSTAPPSARNLLDKATLTTLCESQAVVRVEPRYLRKFEANITKISRMLQKAVGTSQTIAVTFREG